MTANYNILVIDDLQSIHEDFKKILVPERSEAVEKLNQMNEVLFGRVSDTPKLPKFELQFAFQGQEGIEKVFAAMSQNKPFALAFVDVQMPPGIDGIETIKKIWEIDKEIQIVICTAYAKYSWEDIQKKFGNTDRLFILKKPFEKIEILNLATSLTKRWEINRELSHKMALINLPNGENRSDKLEKALKDMNKNIENLKVLNEKLEEQKRKAIH